MWDAGNLLAQDAIEHGDDGAADHKLSAAKSIDNAVIATISDADLE